MYKVLFLSSCFIENTYLLLIMTVRGKKVGQGGSLVGLAGLVLDIIEKTVILGTSGHNFS